ncbi:MAG: response regulator [Elusimicrobiota bacterium]
MPGPRILVVEDDEDMGMLLSHTLRSVGYQVTWSKDGIQALTSARNSPPDLIVSDFMFPAGGGANFFQRLRMAPQTQSVPIVIMSGVPKELISAAVPRDSSTYYLPKPYKKAELLSLIEGMLQGSNYPNFLLHQLPPEGTPPAPKPSRGTVLVIAEGKEDRAALRAPLGGKDFTVVEAADGAEALSALGFDAGSGRPDVLRPQLIIIDAQTDVGSGHVINARLMREQATRSVPVIVVTAKREMRAAFSDANNVSVFLDKPVDPARLVRHAEELVPVPVKAG